MTDLEALFQDVCNNPEDWDGRLVLADCFEECGMQDEAECMRWMSRERKRARKMWMEVRTESERKHFNGYVWYHERVFTYVVRENAIRPKNRLSVLPGALWEEAVFCGEVDRCGGNNYMRVFPSRKQSELAVLTTWKKAKELGWIPETSIVENARE